MYAYTLEMVDVWLSPQQCLTAIFEMYGQYQLMQKESSSGLSMLCSRSFAADACLWGAV